MSAAAIHLSVLPRGLITGFACLMAVPAAAAQAPEIERLSPTHGDRYCQRYSGLCTGAQQVVAAGGLLAWPFSAHHNNEAVVVRPWRAGRAGRARVIARERGVKRVALGFIAAAQLPDDDDVLVAWERQEMEGVGGPIVVRARRVEPDGRPLGRVFELGRIGSFGDERYLEGDSVMLHLEIERSRGGRMLAGWLTPGSRRRYGDRAGVVRRLGRRGRAIGKARRVTDRGADEFFLTPAGNGFAAMWTRQRRRMVYVRGRSLSARGRPLGRAVTLERVRLDEDGWFATPALSARGDELLLVSARRDAAGISLTARRLDADLRPRADRVGIARMGETATYRVDLELAPAPDGSWLLAAAPIPVPDEDYAAPPSPVYAIRLNPDGTARRPLRLVARDGTNYGVALAWDPAAAALAWSADPRGTNFGRIHALALAAP